MFVGLYALVLTSAQAASAPNGFGPVWDLPLPEQGTASGLDLQLADTDGDGLDDLLLRGMDPSEPGLVLVFFGDLVLSPAADLTLSGGDAATGGVWGDLDGDGDADQLTYMGDPATSRSVLVRPGGPNGPRVEPLPVLIDDITQPNGYQKKVPFGDRITDANGDGYGDTMFAAQGTTATGYTHLALHLGGPDGMQSRIAWTRNVDNEFLPTSAAGFVGDLDNDGYQEFVYTSVRDEGEEGMPGTMVVTRGDPAGLRVSFWASLGMPATASRPEGYRAYGAGDLDGDGLGDMLLLIVPGRPGEPATLYGYAGDTRYAFSLSGPEVVFQTTNTSRDPWLLGVGDFNGDGFRDVAVGDPGRPGSSADRSGAVLVFFGNAYGTNVNRPLVIEPDAGEQALGASGVLHDDITGDGMADLVIGYEVDGVPTLQLFPGFADADLDGYQDFEDCGPRNPDIHPGAEEVWYNEVDDACDGGDDFDQDGDGYVRDVDCDDLEPTINPDALEVWYDGVDDNCDGNDDDQDGDGWAASELGGEDCNDTNAAISPDAIDIPDNGMDEDCSGADTVTTEPEGCGCRTGGAPSLWWALGLLALRRRRR